MKGKSKNWDDIPDRPTDPKLYAAWLTANYYAIEAADLADGAAEELTPEQRARFERYQAERSAKALAKERVEARGQAALDLYDLESYLFSIVSPRFQQAGFLDAFDFFCIVIWKANRSKSLAAERLLSRGSPNLETAVKTLTSEVFRMVDDRSRLVYLLKNWGFRLPTASAILTVLYPDRFTIYDTRVCGQLGKFASLADGSNPEPVAAGYFEFMREVSDRGPKGMSLRDKDRVLFAQSFELQLRYDLIEQFGHSTSPQG